MSATMTTPTITEIPTSNLHPSPLNPRKSFTGIEALAADILTRGVLTPLLVRPNAGGYEIVAGERRYRAARVANVPALPCIVRELDDRAALEIALVENLHREDLHPLEEADGYQRLHKEHGHDVTELAAKVGKSKAYVYARLKLCELGEQARKAFFENTLSPSVALLVARIPAGKRQDEAVKEVTQPGWNGEPPSFREVQRILSRHHYNLAEAGFDTTDATLVPKAGPCTICPHRSGNQRELFADVAGLDKQDADVCTSPECFEAKRNAFWQRRKEDARKRGLRVLDEKEAKKLLGDGDGHRDLKGFVDLGEKTYEVDPDRGRKWKQVLGKDVADEVVLARDGIGRIHELMPKDRAREVLKERHPEMSKRLEARSGRSAAERKAQERARLHAETVRGAIKGLVAKIEASKKLPDGYFTALARVAARMAHFDAMKLVAARRGLSEAMKRENRPLGRGGMFAAEARTMTAMQCAALALELLITDGAYWLNSADPARELKDVCDVFGVDWEAQKRAAKEACRPKSSAKTKTKNKGGRHASEGVSS